MRTTWIGLGLLALSVATSTARADASPPRVPLDVVREVTTGKWPEGLVVQDNVAWVADSGDRRLLAIDLKTGEQTPYPVGRLPTAMARTTDGTILALVNTDKRVYRVAPGARKAVLTGALPDCPETMVVDADRLFVLLWSRCSSADGRVARVDPKTGKASPGPMLGAGVIDLAVVGERAYVAHMDTRVTRLDPATLAVLAVWEVPGRHQHLRATAQAVYLDADERLVRLDPATGALTHQVALGARVSTLEVRGESVFVALPSGEIHEFDTADLRLRRVLAPQIEAFEPRALAFHGDHLLVTSFRRDPKALAGDGGRLLVFSVRGADGARAE